MIKWILFDQARVQTYDIFTRKDIYSISDKQFSAGELESIFDLPEYKKFSVGAISEKDLISLFLEKTNLQLSIEEYIEIFKKGIEPIEGMKEILEKLYGKFHLATLINEGSEWASYKLDYSGFRKFFEINIISGDLGLAKPDPEFYKKSLEIIGANPEECIFIDDRKENCDASTKLGMKSIVFQNAEQLKKELTYFSITFD